ncbi:hypothetical protein PR001_g19711 [Phytophthora rubi]|uniref:Uncharacterized protein n=1 Tax=Phytophthora rubi TaxID=129364 RepID=A0A6A3JXM9_9STRA|nr:hypothetical protein PR001_g19711 [Phytophthora rubi]
MEETKESDEDESYCVLAALLPAKARAIKKYGEAFICAGDYICNEYVAVRSSSKHMLGKHTSAAGTCWEASSEVWGIQTERSSAMGARRDLAAEGRRGHARAAHSSRAKRWLRASEASDGLFAGEGSLGNLPDSEH